MLKWLRRSDSNWHTLVYETKKLPLLPYRNILLEFPLTNIYLFNYSITERTSLSIKLRPLYFLSLSKLVQDCLLANFTHHSDCLYQFSIHTKKCSVFLSRLSYFNLVMSYSSFSRTSREIVLFSITYIASYLLDMSCRLIVHCTVYCDYDNSSILLNDKYLHII